MPDKKADCRGSPPPLTEMNANRIRIFNGNTIKLLAAALMLVDHIGFLLYPGLPVLRDIGRVSMPLFAFMVAEGCRYTKNKFRHFSLMFLLGVACQVVYYFFDGGSLYMSILITFSLSVAMIYALQYFKKCLFDQSCKPLDKVLSGLTFCASVFVTYAINTVGEVGGTAFTVDYGFWGCMLPVFAAVTDFRGVELPEKWKFLDGYYIKLALFAVGTVLLCLQPSGLNEWYSLIALVPLALYNGEKGKVKLKYFFYVFYPLHLALLQAIALL